jgi:hypothetical protein
MTGGIMKKYLAFVIVLSALASIHLIHGFEWPRDSAYLNIKLNNDTTTEVQNEEQIVMNPTDSTNLVAVWRDFRVGYRQVAYAYSFDGGLTWGQDLFVEPQYIWDSDPGLTVDTAGNFYAVILSFFTTSQPNGLFVYKSTDGGVTWTGPVTVINQVPDVFEDKELIACDRSGGPHTGNLYVVWTRFGAGTEILMCRSTDEGNSFESPVSISDAGGVQWPVPCVGPNSEVYIAWVKYTPASIRLDRSFDGGQTFSSDIIVQNVNDGSRLINGQIWVFSFPAMDVDITGGQYNGNMYMAFMDDSPGLTDTDMYFTRSLDGGTTWSQKVRINDDPLNNGCDQFHPWLTVAPDGSIIVVFLDRRNDPGNLLMDLYMTTSTDGGDTWSTNERITTVSSDPTAGSTFMDRIEDPVNTKEPFILANRAGLIGEYIGVTASSIDDIHPIWTDTRMGDQDVFVGVADTAGPGIEEFRLVALQRVELSISPNPVRGQILISIEFPEGTQIPLDAYLTLHDVTGRQLEKRKINLSSEGLVYHWNVNDGIEGRLGKGVYFCSFYLGKNVISRKFVIP